MIKADTTLGALLAGPMLAIIAFAVYAGTLSSGACPGESSLQIAQHVGLVPMAVPLHPLWSWLVKSVAMIRWGGTAYGLNLLSAVCGALSVWLLYAVVKNAVYGIIDREHVSERTATLAALLAGVVAAVCFAFSSPFWIVSNRAHMASFHVLVALSIAWVFVRYAFTGSRITLFVFAFLYAVGCVEFATMIVFAPLFGSLLLYLMAQHEHLTVRNIAGVVALAAAGLSLYFISALLFTGTENFRMSGCDGVLGVLWSVWKGQYWLISGSLPREGWLLVLIMCAAPWLTMLGVARGSLNGESDWTYGILHAIMTVISLLVVFETDLSPVRILGRFGAVLVTPNLLVAVVMGYLAAYWFLVLLVLFRGGEDASHTALRRIPGILSAAVFLALVCALPVRTAREAGTHSSALANSYAMETVKSLNGRSWLVTDGNADVLILIAARDAGIPLRVLSLRGDGNDGYMNYVATLFDDPRLKSLAQIGLIRLLDGWFASDPGIGKKVAMQAIPDLFGRAGLVAVPNKLVFFGVKPGEAPRTMDNLEAHRVFWRELVPAAKAVDKIEIEARSGMLAAGILRQMSLVANDLGVALEDDGHKAEAFEAYSRAYEMDSGSWSALLNLEAITLKGVGNGDVSEFRRKLEKLAGGQKDRPGLWVFCRYYGYVRSAAAFAELGYTWAGLGYTGIAAAHMERAVRLLPADRKKEGDASLAAFYTSHDMVKEGEAVYGKLLADDPGNPIALVGLARTARARFDLEAARGYLKRAEGAGADKALLAIESAYLEVTAGDYGSARTILETLVVEKPRMLDAWQLLGEVLLHENDTEAMDAYLKRVSEVSGAQMPVAFFNAQLAIRKKDTRLARRALEQAFGVNPGNIRVLDQLLKLDMADGDRSRMAEHARAILKIDPDHSFANYTMGSLKAQDGNYEMAEVFYRRSLEKERLPQVLNDLAWLLQKRGEFQEAERLARKAIEANGKMPRAWDTLGVTLMRSGTAGSSNLEEAERALTRALDLAPNGPAICLHMAELQVKMGRQDRARLLIEKVRPKRHLLPAGEQKTLDQIDAKVRLK